MRVSNVLAIVFASFSVVCQAADQSVTIYAWPLDSPSPQELAKVTYNPESSTTAKISNYKPPKAPSSSGKTDAEQLVRVGLYDSSTKDWRGVVTAATSFDPKYQQKIDLHLDLDGSPWHVGFSAYQKPKPTQKRRRAGEEVEVVPQLVVDVLKAQPGPTPHLNKPVVLSSEGKVEEKPEEKTFLQKYWWMIGIFLLVQLLSAGTGDDKAAEKK